MSDQQGYRAMYYVDRRFEWYLTIPKDGTIFAKRLRGNGRKPEILYRPQLGMIEEAPSVDLSESSDDDICDEDTTTTDEEADSLTFDTRHICVFCDQHYSCDVRIGCRMCGHIFHRTCWEKFSQFTRFPTCPICNPSYEPIYGCPFGCARTQSEKLRKFRIEDDLIERVVISKRRRGLLDWMRNHVSNKHAVILCMHCGTKILFHNRASHRGRKCGTDETKCPVNGCSAVIGNELCQLALSNPSVLSNGYHLCQELSICVICGSFHLSDEDLRAHAFKCKYMAEQPPIIRKRRKSAQKAEILITLNADLLEAMKKRATKSDH